MNTVLNPTVLKIGGGTITVLVSGDATAGRVETFDFYAPPGQPGPGTHLHETCDEFFNVLAGEAEFCLDGATFRVGAGSAVVARRGVAHCWRNVGSSPLRMIVTFSPSIAMEMYFTELSALIAETGGIPPREKIEALWSRFDTIPA